MSILLEALRKSEKSQRTHEVPTIHRSDEIAMVPESLATGPLAILLISAMFMSGWFVWHQYQVPAPAVQPAVAGTRESAPESPKKAVGDQSAVTGTPSPPVTDKEAVVANKKPAVPRQQSPLSAAKDESSSVTNPVASDARAVQTKSSKAVAAKSTGKQRTPMESYKAPARIAKKAEPANSDRPAVTQPPAKTVDKGNKLTGADAKVKKAVEATRPKPRPEVPRPIGYWELPDKIRANLPEIKFSVLVYASNPSDRFVLISGERLVEGDKAGRGLVVKEIRRDGVIFSYRSYQFLVEK